MALRRRAASIGLRLIAKLLTVVRCLDGKALNEREWMELGYALAGRMESTTVVDLTERGRVVRLVTPPAPAPAVADPATFLWWARVAWIFEEAWEAVLKRQHEQRPVSYLLKAPTTTAEVWLEQGAKMLAATATERLLSSAVDITSGIHAHLVVRFDDVPVCHRRVAEAVLTYRDMWCRAQRWQSNGVGPGIIDTFEELVCHPTWLTLMTDMTPFETALDITRNLCLIGEFFTLEARRVAS